VQKNIQLKLKMNVLNSLKTLPIFMVIHYLEILSFDLNSTRVTIPSNYTKLNIFNKYKLICVNNNELFVEFPTFEKLWAKYKPDIKIMTPRSDVF